jgi:tRNA 2-thiouridine synthesizing protein E
MSINKIVNDLVDNEGFVTLAELWDRDLALAIAAEHGIVHMSAVHWRVIDHLRAKYLEKGVMPWLTHECRQLDLHDNCFYELFGGPLVAWKIAGLPDPGEEAKTYLENEEPD